MGRQVSGKGLCFKYKKINMQTKAVKPSASPWLECPGQQDKEKRTEESMADLLADERVEKSQVGETALLQQNVQAPDQR